MDTSEEWSAVFNGEASSSDTQRLLRGALTQLDQRIVEDPATGDSLSECLSIRLTGPINESTLQSMQDSITAYMGQDIAFLITWLSQESPPARRLAQLEPLGPDRAVRLLRYLMGRFGKELVNANDRNTQPADDWREVGQNVLLDELTGFYRFRTRILKYNGDECVLECGPNSALQLVLIMARALTAVSSPSVYQPELLRQYFEATDALRAFAPVKKKRAPRIASASQSSDRRL